jgi:hypothetical protein
MLASTVKLRPRYFLIVLALAGDSTITRLVLPLTMGPSLLPALLLLALEVLERLLVAALVVLVDLRGEAVVPLFLVVVAIIWW